MSDLSEIKRTIFEIVKSRLESERNPIEILRTIAITLAEINSKI